MRGPTCCADLRVASVQGGVDRDEEKAVPKEVYNSELTSLLHKQETSFGLPKAVIYMAFHAPQCYSSPENAVLTQLYVRLLLDHLNELSYDAELAGLNYDARGTTTGFLLSFSG